MNRLTHMMPLRRSEAAAFLRGRGIPITEAALATKATRGGGPAIHYWGRLPLYWEKDLLEWAEQRLASHRRMQATADRLEAMGLDVAISKGKSIQPRRK